jgi:hypothetical protein
MQEPEAQRGEVADFAGMASVFKEKRYGRERGKGIYPGQRMFGKMFAQPWNVG